MSSAGAKLKIFTTCPRSALAPGKACRLELERVARWSEQAGCEGMLVFADNGQLDPWLVSQLVIDATTRLCPLVAIQPVYMHPYSVAKMVATLAHLHGRRVYLNMVAGGFKNDLAALNDTTPHDERYARLVEYTRIVAGLLLGARPVSFEGRYYKVENLRLTPAAPPELAVGLLLSGSSAAGVQAARELGATAVEYPKPASDYEVTPEGADRKGLRIGLITRPDEASAWAVARARFPQDRQGQLAYQLAMKVSDSSWHRQLSDLGAVGDGPYWLAPFRNYQAACPYLVGSYDRVAEEIRRYLEAGYRTFILDEPAQADELEHVAAAFTRAARGVPA